MPSSESHRISIGMLIVRYGLGNCSLQRMEIYCTPEWVIFEQPQMIMRYKPREPHIASFLTSTDSFYYDTDCTLN